ncbi:hypothetical protein PVAND_007558 [Polypedilum vanderplanki]|uniref:TM2 domain-containing protein n=1 Tax=Polypedilum vanderplanki TaxID=319348 RepID=A0A9J6C6N8_POLVA|nr:hypothetical protein PVAND_007558 [Polypedilum vanderplanki]
MNRAKSVILFLFLGSIAIVYATDCTKLRVGQFLCPDPDSSYDYIDKNTQSVIGCKNDSTATVRCLASEGIICSDTGNNTFYGKIDCDYTNGKHFDVALILSIFLGMFGIDRFYLGYYAIGFFKLFTLGFLFLGQLIDVILIASQILGPADGSKYIIPVYGPKLTIIQSNNATFRVPTWFD